MPRLLLSATIAVLIAGGAYALLSGNAPAPPAAGPPVDLDDPRLRKAVFAGGCFWCLEAAFEEVPGVVAAISGYAGGSVPAPTYEQVSSGGTGHAESVQVVYDPARVSYAALLEIFWRNVDPTTPDRQFCDVGGQYRSAIFPSGPEQERLALASRQALRDQGRFPRVATEIAPLTRFWPAEEYHQDWYGKKGSTAACHARKKLW